MRNFKDSRVMFHLLGTVKYDLVNQLQKQIVNLSTFSTAINPRQITVLLCEHDPVVTVGYSGSRSHIRLKAEQLQKQNLRTQWVNRGGGCYLHGEGQLCVYPIVPLSTFSASTKAITRLLRDAVRSGLEEIDYFDALIQPKINPVLSNYFINLTGITQDTIVQNGKSFPEIFGK